MPESTVEEYRKHIIELMKVLEDDPNATTESGPKDSALLREAVYHDSIKGCLEG